MEIAADSPKNDAGLVGLLRVPSAPLRIASYFSMALLPNLAIHGVIWFFDEHGLLTSPGQVPVLNDVFTNTALSLSGWLFLLLALPLDRPWKAKDERVVRQSTKLVMIRVIVVGCGALVYGVSIPAAFWPS